MRHLLHRIKNLVSPSSSDSESFPRSITVQALGESFQFRAYSEVEVYRTQHFGGERTALELFMGALQDDDVVYDIGASVGLFAVAAGQQVHSGNIYAFEPDPETRSRLEENLHLNDIENASVIPWAASDESSHVTLYTDGVSGYAPTMRSQEREGAPTGTVDVKTHTLDEAIASKELQPPTFLKIDIEGAEILCLRGAKDLLSGAFGARPRAVFVEIHPEFLPDYGATHEDVTEILEQNNYCAVWQAGRDAQNHRLYIHTSMY